MEDGRARTGDKSDHQARDDGFRDALEQVAQLRDLDWTADSGIRCSVIPALEEEGLEALEACPLGMLAAANSERYRERLRDSAKARAFGERIETTGRSEVMPRLRSERQLGYSDHVGDWTHAAVAATVTEDPVEAAECGLLEMDGKTVERMKRAADYPETPDGERLVAALASKHNELQRSWDLHWSNPLPINGNPTGTTTEQRAGA